MEPFFSHAFAAAAREGEVLARVASESREVFHLLTPEGGAVVASLSGALRNDPLAEYPVAGDWVRLQPSGLRVEGVLPRRTRIVRQAVGGPTRAQILAANVDTGFLVTGLDREFRLRGLERFLLALREGGVEPVVVLNKVDVVADREPILALASTLGAPVAAVSALTGEGVDALAPWLAPGRTVAVLGPSGVGKSTLLNRLRGDAVALTGDVRASDGRGRHTTTRRELLPLPSGAFLLDTPGLRELGLWSGRAIDEAFEDVGALATSCRFGDCTHTAEPGCAVQEALATGDLDEGRYGSYQKLQRELHSLAVRQDVGARLAERKRWKAIHKAHRQRERYR